MQKIKLFISIFISLLFVQTSCNDNSKQEAPPASEKAFYNKDGDTMSPPPPPSARIDPADILNERKLTAYVESVPVILSNKKNGKPFDTLIYDKVIAYDFDGSEEPYPAVVDKKGKFVPVIVNQQYLSQQQTDKIIAILTSKSTYGGGTAACFQPHFGLVFYNGNKMVNQINVCLGCNYMISAIPIPAETESGFSKKGRNAIRALCKELNFYYGE